MAYRKLGRTNKQRRSMLSTLTKQLILNESIKTTETIKVNMQWMLI